MTAFRLAASFVIVCLASFTAAMAQQGERITHRTAVPAGDAAPTNGSFSIRFPIAYDDIEMRVDDAQSPTLVVRLLTGVNNDGLRFSATEMPVLGSPKPLDSMVEAAKSRPGANVTDIKHEQNGENETLSFALTEPKGGTFLRMMRIKSTGYTLTVQYPNTLYGTANKMKAAFFDSFKTIKP